MMIGNSLNFPHVSVIINQMKDTVLGHKAGRVISMEEAMRKRRAELSKEFRSLSDHLVVQKEDDFD